MQPQRDLQRRGARALRKLRAANAAGAINIKLRVAPRGFERDAIGRLVDLDIELRGRLERLRQIRARAQ